MGKRHAAGVPLSADVTRGCVCPGADLSGGRAIEGGGNGVLVYGGHLSL